MSEQRFKLTEKQYKVYSTARLQLIQAKQAFDAAQVNISTVSELIFDHFELDTTVQARVDDDKKELVVAEQPPKVEEVATKKPQRGKAAAVVTASDPAKE